MSYQICVLEPITPVWVSRMSIMALKTAEKIKFLLKKKRNNLKQSLAQDQKLIEQIVDYELNEEVEDQEEEVNKGEVRYLPNHSNQTDINHSSFFQKKL